MKKLVLALAATAAIASPVAFGQANTQATAELVISGEVTEAACGMTVDNIDFKSISTRRFETAANSTWLTSKIVFDDCKLVSATEGETASSINISFGSGTEAEGKANLWANNGGSENIGIELQVDGKAVPPRNAGNVVVQLDENNLENIKRVEVPVRARVVRLADNKNVTPGSILGNVTIIADFK